MPLKIVKNSEESGLSLHSVMNYMGELCGECGEVRLLHPQPYVYTCPYCRFSFQINPVSRKKPITILHKSEVKKKHA